MGTFSVMSKDENPVKEFSENLKELAADLGVLLRKDLEEARAEMVGKAKAAGMGAGLISGSLMTGLLTLFSITVLAMVLLSAVMSLWLAVLLVTIFWAIATAVLAMGGKKKFQEAGPPIPQHAIKNVTDDLKAATQEL
ncbi:MAG: phage holin family protein [Candidatus Eremiobacteraeota bacterium]|nr:phage holin family protein [Candidatus Eremiobacteraeota bacterium]